MRIFQTIAVALGLLGATVSTAQANYAERAGKYFSSTHIKYEYKKHLFIRFV